MIKSAISKVHAKTGGSQVSDDLVDELKKAVPQSEEGQKKPESSEKAVEDGTASLAQKAVEMAEGWQRQSDLEEKEKEIEVLKEKVQENWDLYLRARADIENVRRRFLGEAENAKKFAIEKLGREILSVVDSLEQGLQASESQESLGMREGMELTLKLLLDTLDKFGIRQLNPLGEVFNPLFHEALSMQMSSEVEPNRVMLVVQKGFILHERLLRPARVIVSKKENG